MESYHHTFLINRDPPSLKSVQDLANVYFNSRELFKSTPISIEPLEHYRPLGATFNKNTLLLCTKLPIIHFFAKEELDQNNINASPFHYLILDIENVEFNLNAVEFLLKSLPSEKKIAVFNDWRKAVLKAMLYAAKKLETNQVFYS